MPLLPKRTDDRAVDALEAATAELRRLGNLIERYLVANNVPELPDPAAAAAATAESGAATEVRDEWQIAIDEEVARRRQESA